MTTQGAGKEKLIKLRDAIKEKGRISGVEFLDKVIGGIRENGEIGEGNHSRRTIIKNPRDNERGLGSAKTRKTISVHNVGTGR